MVAGFSLQQYMGNQVLFIICGCWFFVTTAHGRSIIIILNYDYHENGAKKECGLNSRLHPFFTLQVVFVASHS